MIGPNIILPFDGNHASIPAGFSRDTRFDNKFLKGAASGLGTTSGASTHTHTASHTHTVASHTHTATISEPINGDTFDAGTSGSRVDQAHRHDNTVTGTSGTEASGSTSASLTASANLPPYYTVIFIKSLTYNLIPIGGMIFRTTSRLGMSFHTASENKFLCGANTGANAGSTGGATNHYHSQSHTHTANAHSHATGTTTKSPGTAEDGQTGPALADDNHTHTFTVQTATQNMDGNTTNSSTTDNIPVNITLLHYKATQKTLPIKGDIALTTETETPIGWLECNGNNNTPDLRDYYIKNTNTYGSTSGVNTHTHTLSHSHTGSGSHTHTDNDPTSTANGTGGRNGSGHTPRSAHAHNISSIGYATANYNTTNPTSTEVNHEPPYIKVKFIQFEFSVGGGALFAMA